MMAHSRKLLILDNEMSFRSHCRELLRAEQQFLLVDADEATILSLLQADQPDIVLLGPSIFGTQRSQFLKLMNLCWPTCRILLLEEFPADEQLVGQLGATTVGILARDELEDFLAKAVHKVYEGEAWVPRKLVHGLVERLRAQA